MEKDIYELLQYVLENGGIVEKTTAINILTRISMDEKVELNQQNFSNYIFSPLTRPNKFLNSLSENISHIGSEALKNLAISYEFGVNKRQDLNRATDCLIGALEIGDLEVIRNLEGLARKESIKAQLFLIDLYTKGNEELGIAPDQNKVNQFSEMLNNNRPINEFRYGLYLYGNKDKENGINHIVSSIEKNNILLEKIKDYVKKGGEPDMLVDTYIKMYSNKVHNTLCVDIKQFLENVFEKNSQNQNFKEAKDKFNKFELGNQLAPQQGHNQQLQQQQSQNQQQQNQLTSLLQTNTENNPLNPTRLLNSI